RLPRRARPLALYRHYPRGRENHGDLLTLLSVRHATVYRYARPVQFGEHCILVIPRDSAEQFLGSFKLDIFPEPANLRWIHDVFGNAIAIASFDTPAQELRITANMVIDHVHNREPNFEIAERARTYPFDYGQID